MWTYSSRSPNHNRRLTVTLSGLERMDCERLKKQLENEPGVVSAFISPRTEMAYIIYDPDITHPAALRMALEAHGIEVGIPQLR